MKEPRNRVVRVRRFGDPNDLEVVGAPFPAAGRGEVRVRGGVDGKLVSCPDLPLRRELVA